MRRGRKKPESDRTGTEKAGSKEPGRKKPDSTKFISNIAESKEPETDESDVYKLTGDQISSDKTGIDGVRALQIITVGIAVLLLIWWVLRNILHTI